MLLHSPDGQSQLPFAFKWADPKSDSSPQHCRMCSFTDSKNPPVVFEDILAAHLKMFQLDQGALPQSVDNNDFQSALQALPREHHSNPPDTSLNLGIRCSISYVSPCCNKIPRQNELEE